MSQNPYLSQSSALLSTTRSTTHSKTVQWGQTPCHHEPIFSYFLRENMGSNQNSFVKNCKKWILPCYKQPWLCNLSLAATIWNTLPKMSEQNKKELNIFNQFYIQFIHRFSFTFNPQGRIYEIPSNFCIMLSHFDDEWAYHHTYNSSIYLHSRHSHELSVVYNLSDIGSYDLWCESLYSV